MNKFGVFLLALPLSAQTINFNQISSIHPGGTRGPVRAPTLSAAANWIATGGSIPANTYAVQETFAGDGGGETTPTPNADVSGNAYGTVVTTGTASTIYVGAQEAPPGASCFYVYIQTGGSGGFYKQGTTCTPLGQMRVFVAVPAAFGPTPPTTNTAVSLVATAISSLGGPGGVLVPSAYTGTGAAGDPLPGQSIFDYRQGSLNIHSAGVPMKTSFYADVLGVANVDMAVPTGFSIGQQAQALCGVIHDEANPYYGGGLNMQQNGALVANCGQAITASSSANSTWGGLFGVGFTGLGNANTSHYALEADVFNQAGNQYSQAAGIGVHSNCSGNFQCLYGLWITASNGPTDSFIGGIRIEDGTVKTTGLYVGSGSTTGIQSNSPNLFTSTTTNPVLQVVPGNDSGANTQMSGRNHANTATTWSVNNDGSAAWTTVFTQALLSAAANRATVGLVRAAAADALCWANAANSGNVCIAKNSADNVTVPSLQISGISGTTQCLAVNSSGQVSGIGAPCGTGSGSGSVTSVATSGPLTGGPITSSGTIGCPSCLTTSSTSAAALTSVAGGTLGTAAFANLSSMSISGGSINGTVIGGTSPAAANLTTLGVGIGSATPTESIVSGGALEVRGSATTNVANAAVLDFYSGGARLFAFGTSSTPGTFSFLGVTSGGGITNYGNFNTAGLLTANGGFNASGQKVSAIANGTASTDAAAFGQIPFQSAWVHTTPTPTSSSGSFSSASTDFALLTTGKTAAFNVNLTVTNYGTASGSVSIPVPFAAKNHSAFICIGPSTSTSVAIIEAGATSLTIYANAGVFANFVTVNCNSTVETQ